MRAVALTAGLLYPLVGHCQTVTAAPPAPGWYLAQALVSLALVVGLVLLAHYGLRQWDRRTGRQAGKGPMTVLQALPLGAGRALYLVRVGRKALVVGGGPQGLHGVAELPLEDLEEAEQDGG